MSPMSLRKKRIALVRLSAIPVIFLAVFVRPGWDVESVAAFWIELTGYLFLLSGLSVRIWSIFYIGGRKSHTLVTEGPYSLCRNPLYVGTFLLTIGVGLCFENILMLAAVILILVPIHLLTAKLEERHLLELFPEAYPEYAQRVPHFLPRFSNYHTAETITVNVRVIRRIAVDTVGVLLLPEIEDLLEILHQQHIIPTLMQFP
jgi:protein-S-isoprenylcysteine O-methyltransferase Ste14